MKLFKVSMFIFSTVLALPVCAAKKETHTDWFSCLSPKEQAQYQEELRIIEQTNEEEFSQCMKQISAVESNANKTIVAKSPFSVRLNLNGYLHSALLIARTIATLAIMV